MRAKQPPRFVVVLVVIVVVAAVVPVTFADPAPRPGELIPYEDPSQKPWSVVGSSRPGPMYPDYEPETSPTPWSAPDPFESVPDVGEIHSGSPSGSTPSGAILSARGGGAGISRIQEAKRSLKRLIRELG